MTDLTARAQALLDAADKMTPGPWHVVADKRVPISALDRVVGLVGDGRSVAVLAESNRRAMPDRDATGIVTLRNDAPAIVRDLLAAKERADEDLAAAMTAGRWHHERADAAEQRATKAEAEAAELLAACEGLNEAAALNDDALAHHDDILTALEAWKARATKAEAEIERLTAKVATEQATLRAALQERDIERAEVERLRAPVDAEGEIDALLMRAYRLARATDAHRAQVTSVSADRVEACRAQEADARAKLLAGIGAIERDARSWHAARVILDGAREAHEQATQGKWIAHAGRGEPDDGIITHELTGETIATCSTDDRDDDAEPIDEAMAIVADHAAVDELLRLARGEGK